MQLNQHFDESMELALSRERSGRMKPLRSSRYVLDLFGAQSSPYEVWSRRNKETPRWFWLRNFIEIGQVRDVVFLKLDQGSNQARSQKQISNVYVCASILLSSVKSNPLRVIEVPP